MAALTRAERATIERKAWLAAALATHGRTPPAGFDVRLPAIGEQAAEAIRTYRALVSLPPGPARFTPDVLDAMRKDAPEGSPLGAATLSLDARGPLVEAWQHLLRAKGFVVTADGRLGPKTWNATTVARLTLDLGDAGPVTDAFWRSMRRLVVKPRRTLRDLLGMAPRVVDARRGGAGFPMHAWKRWSTRQSSTVTTIIGHYTGGAGSFLADARFHVESPYLDEGGAPAIAYAIGVDLDGTVYVFNDARDVTWHCDGGRNTDTIGIVFRGGAEGMTPAQERSMAWLLDAAQAGKLEKYGHPASFWPKRLSTHRHVKPTSCPGERGEAQYEAHARKLGYRWTTTP